MEDPPEGLWSEPHLRENGDSEGTTFAGSFDSMSHSLIGSPFTTPDTPMSAQLIAQEPPQNPVMYDSPAAAIDTPTGMRENEDRSTLGHPMAVAFSTESSKSFRPQAPMAPVSHPITPGNQQGGGYIGMESQNGWNNNSAIPSIDQNAIPLMFSQATLPNSSAPHIPALFNPASQQPPHVHAMALVTNVNLGHEMATTAPMTSVNASPVTSMAPSADATLLHTEVAAPVPGKGERIKATSSRPKKNKTNATVGGSTAGTTRRAKFRRSRTGCMVCRKRKVKCDQDGLPCKQCRIGKRDCHYEENPPKRKRKSKSEAIEMSNDQTPKKAMYPVRPPSQPSPIKSRMPVTAGPGPPHINAAPLPPYTVVNHVEKLEDTSKEDEEFFAQHTNFDDSDDDDDDVESNDTRRASADEDVSRSDIDISATQSAADDDMVAQTKEGESKSSLEQEHTTLSTLTGFHGTEDWSITTPSTGATSVHTFDCDTNPSTTSSSSSSSSGHLFHNEETGNGALKPVATPGDVHKNILGEAFPGFALHDTPSSFDNAAPTLVGQESDVLVTDKMPWLPTTEEGYTPVGMHVGTHLDRIQDYGSS